MPPSFTISVFCFSTCLQRRSQSVWIPFQSLIFIEFLILPTSFSIASHALSFAERTTRSPSDAESDSESSAHRLALAAFAAAPASSESEPEPEPEPSSEESVPSFAQNRDMAARERALWITKSARERNGSGTLETESSNARAERG